ncbi:MAG: GPI anchored serine-threonine rich family protein [Cytophagales bacterium]|nr:GPI anchored serine-threonine rich family protein [Cytophagales bacterium]
MKLKLNFLILPFISFLTPALGQELDSVSMEFREGKIIVHYDFLDGEEDEIYELYLYGSHDNFSEPLQFTTGDVGKNIRIGAGKIIYWDAKTELGNFKGDFSLKIKGSTYVPLVSFENIHPRLKIKRGEVFEIKWDVNTKDDQVLLKMQRNGVPIVEPFLIENTGSYRWEVPSKLKAGKGYSIQILDNKNLIKEETSESFSVKRSIPLALKIIPVALAAGATAYLVTKKTDQGIPGPPAPPSR